MSKTCNGCKEQPTVSVPYVVHESAMARSERGKKRLLILLFISWISILLVIGLFTYESLQYDYSNEEIIVDSEDGGNANYIGNDGDIVNGKDKN